MMSLIFYKKKVRNGHMSIDIINMCSGQGAHCARVAKLKRNVAQWNFILDFAIIPVKKCREKEWQQYQ